MILLSRTANKKIIKQSQNEIDHSSVEWEMRYRARQFLTFGKMVRKKEEQAENIRSAFSNFVSYYSFYWHYA